MPQAPPSQCVLIAREIFFVDVEDTGAAPAAAAFGGLRALGRRGRRI
jgi:hypothetical protein